MIYVIRLIFVLFIAYALIPFPDWSGLGFLAATLLGVVSGVFVEGSMFRD